MSFDGTGVVRLGTAQAASVAIGHGGCPVEFATDGPLHNLVDPVEPQDAATRAFVEDAVAHGLPATVQSVADLAPLAPNHTIYTSATDTFAATPLSAAGRGLIAADSAANQRAVLQLTVGTDVQPYSAVLQGIAGVGAVANNRVLVSSGVNTFTTSVAGAGGLAVLAGATAGAEGTVVVWGATQSQGAPPLAATSGVSVSGVALDTLKASVLSAPSVTSDASLVISTQLGDITVSAATDVDVGAGNNTTITSVNNTTITSGSDMNIKSLGVLTVQDSEILNASWGHLAALDQNVGTTATPAFAGASMSLNRVTLVADPVDLTDATSKRYVDTVSRTGAPPLAAAKYATAAALPNTPSYYSIGGTLTAAANAALVVDAAEPPVGARVVVIHEATAAHNGVYTVTAAGDTGAPWVLTRSADFSVGPVVAGTAIYVGAGSPGSPAGVTLSGSTWALQATVADVGVSDVVWLQTGGGVPYSAGAGIEFAGATVGVRATDRFTFAGGELELATVAPTFGGTGLNLGSAATGQLLVTAGNAPMSLKAAPASAVVGTVDVQELQNKTLVACAATDPSNNIRARGLGDADGTHTVTIAGGSPAEGDVLTVAANTSTAVWAAPAAAAVRSYMRHVTVAAAAVEGARVADFTSVAAALAAAADGSLPGGAATAEKPVVVAVYPGIYTEPTMLVVPSHVTVAGVGDARDVVFRMGTSSTGGVQLGRSSSLRGVFVDAAHFGIAGSSGIGVEVSYASAGAGAGFPAQVSDVIVRDYATGFQTTGHAPDPDTSVAELRATSVVTSTNYTGLVTGYRATNGSTLTVSGSSATGVIADSSSTLDCGVNVVGSASGPTTRADIRHTDITTANTCVQCTGKHAHLTVSSGTFAEFSQYGLQVEQSATVEISDIRIDDGSATSFGAYQCHIRVGAGNADDGDTVVRAHGVIMRADLVIVEPTFTKTYGSALSTEPGIPVNQIFGNLSVGHPMQSGETSLGGGRPHTFGLVALRYTGAASTSVDGTFEDDVTGIVQRYNTTMTPAFASGAAGDALYIGSATGTFVGLVVDQSDGDPLTPAPLNTIEPPGGDGNNAGGDRRAAAEPPAYLLIWEYYAAAGWVRFPVMCTASAAPFATRRGDTFDVSADALRHTYRFGALADADQLLPDQPYTSSTNVDFTAAPWLAVAYAAGGGAGSWRGATPPVWQLKTINDIPAYWVRVRLTGALTQVPGLNHVRLVASHANVNGSGIVEYHGAARPVKIISHGLGEWFANATTAPTSGVVAVSAKLAITQPLSLFTHSNGQNRGIVRTLRLPAGIDTSHGLVVRWSWVASTASAAAVRWAVNWAYVSDYAAKSGATSDVYLTSGSAPDSAATEQRVWFDQPAPAVAHKQVTTAVHLDISNGIAVRNDEGDGDVVWISVERVANDEYQGNVSLNNISIMAKFAFEGSFDM